MLVYCHIKLNNSVVHKTPQTVRYRDYTYFNLDEFKNEANLINWVDVEHLLSINDKIDFINDRIKSLFDNHAPLVVRDTNIKKTKRPYITHVIKLMIRERNKLFKKFKRTKATTDYNNYREMKNFVTFSIREEKKAYFRYKVGQIQNNSKELWKFFDKHNVHKKKLNSISNDIHDPNAINSYFLNSLPNQPVDPNTVAFFTSNMYDDSFNHFNLKPISIEECSKYMSNLKSQSVGCDNINAKMIGLLPEQTVGALTHILNYSLIHSTFPDIWKKSIITPIAKVSYAEELSQLRPVNITSSISKLCERAVLDQLTEYINENNILPVTQSGFRTLHSTSTAMMKVTSDISRELDQNKIVFLVCLDYSKAFEVINHELLLAKLHFYGIRGKAHDWFRDFLHNRYQCVKLGNSYSEFLQVRQGVPQGTMLSSLLFILFTADMNVNVVQPCKAHYYADDTQIYVAAKPDEINEAIDNINNTLNLIHQWSLKNGLCLNVVKTQAICIGSPLLSNKALSNVNRDIMMNDTKITLSNYVKSLGIIIDSQLNFEEHVKRKTRTAFGKLKTLYQFKNLLHNKLKFNLSQALVMSIVDYGSLVYYNYLNSAQKNQIQMLQNACFRFSYNVPWKTHISPYYIKENILKMEFKYLRTMLLFIFKLIKNKRPKYLYDFLMFHQIERTLRRRNTILPKVKTAKFKKSFCFYAAYLHNKYYDLLYNNNSLYLFKKCLDKSMFAEQLSAVGRQ